MGGNTQGPYAQGETSWRKKNVDPKRIEGLVQSAENQDLLATKELNAEAGVIEGEAKTEEDPFETWDAGRAGDQIFKDVILVG